MRCLFFSVTRTLSLSLTPRTHARAWLAKKNRGKKTAAAVQGDYATLTGLGLATTYGQDTLAADDFYHEALRTPF